MPTAYNKGQRAAPDAPEAPAPRGVQLQPEQTSDPSPAYASEEEEFLYGPTDRPDEPVTAGATTRRAVPPESITGWITKLVAASREPGAPPELQLFLRRIREALEVD